MRITHVVVTDNFAGTERYVCDVSRALAQRGHEVSIIGGAPERMARECGSEVHWTSGGTPPRALAALVRGGHRDIVHTHLSHADTVGVIGQPFHRGAVIATRHIATRRGSTMAAQLIAQMLTKRIESEVAISHFVAAAMERPPNEILHNGVRPLDSKYDPGSR